MGPRSRAVFPYSFQIHVVDPKTEDIIETIGEMNNFAVAHAAFNAAAQIRTHSTVQLREKTMILWTVRTGAYDSVTRTVAELERF
ncbi:hypothetical protein BO068_005183 [Escherichia coli]|nr:hypothetical protein [Salmonella enterica subsp. enterica serovar Virchow]EBW2250075.1 hypothetical protein [Salmonella enterica subsp. enterica serovar Enteritidis]EFG2885982.1 hypothetical protein [Escherichia coli]